MAQAPNATELASIKANLTRHKDAITVIGTVGYSIDPSAKGFWKPNNPGALQSWLQWAMRDSVPEVRHSQPGCYPNGSAALPAAVQVLMRSTKRCRPWASRSTRAFSTRPSRPPRALQWHPVD